MLSTNGHLQVWLSYAKFEATPLAVLAMPAEDDEELEEEARQQQLAEAEEAEGGEAGTGASRQNGSNARCAGQNCTHCIAQCSEHI